MKPFSFQIVCLLAAWHATGPLPASAQAPEQKAAQALENFFQIGLPETRGAKWVTVQIFGDLNASSPIPSENPYDMSSNGGNAWLLSENKDGTVDLLINQTRRIRAKVVKNESPEEAPPGQILQVTMKPADLTADLKALVKAVTELEKAARAGKDADDYRWQRTLQSLGPTILFLTHLRHHDQAEESQKILASVLKLAPKPAQVLDKAVAAMANGTLSSLLANWNAGGSVAEYADGLEKLCAAITRGWPERSGALLLAKRLRAQTPSPRAASPDAEKIAKLLLGMPAQDFEKIPLQTNWFLPPPEQSSDGFSSMRMRFFRGRRMSMQASPKAGNAVDFGPLAELMADKNKGTAILADLLGDQRFLRQPSSSEDESRFSYSYGEEEPKSAEENYKEMPRPLQLGEWVSSLLSSIMPGNDDGDDEGHMGLSYEQVSAWLKEAASLNEEQLAWKYLRRAHSAGSPTFEVSLMILAKQGGPETITKLQEVFMDPAVWENENDTVVTALGAYMARLGDKQGEMANKLEAALKSAIEAQKKAQLESMGSLDERTKKSIEQSSAQRLSRIRAVLHPQSLNEVLREFAESNEEQAMAKMPQVMSALKSKPAGALNAILQAAAKIKSTKTKTQFLAQLGMLLDGIKPEPLNDEARTALQTLLADTTKVESYRMTPTGPVNVADYASQLVFMGTLPPEAKAGWEKAVEAFPSIGKKWVKRIATAVAKGEPIPAAPDASRVSKEALDTILKQLDSAKAGEIQQRMETLNPDEQIALQTYLAKAPEWPPALMAAHLTIAEIEPLKGGPDLSKWKGRRIDAASFAELGAEMENAALANTQVAVILSIEGPLSGITIRMQEAPRQVAEEQIKSLNVPGLEGKPRPDCILLTQFIGEPGRMPPNAAMYLIPLWKKAELTKEWKAAHLKFEGTSAAEDQGARRHNPIAFTEKFKALCSLSPQSRKSLQLVFFTTNVGDKNLPPPSMSRPNAGNDDH